MWNPLLLRAVVAFLALPGIIAFVVPLWIASSDSTRQAFHPVALPILTVGIVLLLWCVRDFYVAGRGTLAPWAPPRHLVTVGLYRLSRNPMYIAVGIVVIGWAIGFGSIVLALYTVALMLLFHMRVIFYEEPRLREGFGGEWTRYRGEVPRWLGRRRSRTSHPGTR